GSETVQRFDAAVIATPLPSAARIYPQHAATATLSHRLKYSQAITVAIATRNRPGCDALLVQMPPNEDPDIALIFLDHNKGTDRAPAACGLFSAHWEASA